MSRELRIRNLPDKLQRQLEAEAGAIGLPLEDYLLTLLLRTLSDRPPRRPARRSLGSQRHAFYEQAALECLSTLTEPEATVIKMRFGIGDAAPHSLQSIADTMGISKQRVHQIEADARRKLKHPARPEVLAFAMRKLDHLDHRDRW